MATMTNPCDWANDAFLALSPSPLKFDFDDFTTAPQQQSYSIPPSLTQSSIERHGQLTPPDDLSLSDSRRDSTYRGSSIPLEQLQNEALWPADQYTSFQDLDAQQSQPQDHESVTTALDPPNKRRRTSKASSASQNKAQTQNLAPTLPSPSQQNQTSSPQTNPSKRRRGRPKNNPQPEPDLMEYSNESGFVVPVTSARQSHLEKNRLAAHKCRQRKKEFIGGLEQKARELTSQNKLLHSQVALLREEILGLKNEVLRHAGCGFWGVDEYLARCAGDLLGKDNENGYTSVFNNNITRKQSQTQSPTMSILSTEDKKGSLTNSSVRPSGSPSSSMGDDFAGLDLLKTEDET